MTSNYDILGDSETQTAALESNALAENYHDWLCSLAFPYLGESPLEIGSGLGGYAETWLGMGLEKITVTEVDPVRKKTLLHRFAEDDRVSFGQIDLGGTHEQAFSAVVSFNVMEHMTDDIAALRAARHTARSGGAVITFAPAFPFAMSRFDRAIGHVRRYTLASMRSAYESAGLRVDTCRYVNAPGLLAWFLGMKVMRLSPQDGPTIRRWDNWVVPRARWWESRHKVPFGQSVFCVGHGT